MRRSDRRQARHLEGSLRFQLGDQISAVQPTLSRNKTCVRHASAYRRAIPLHNQTHHAMPNQIHFSPRELLLDRCQQDLGSLSSRRCSWYLGDHQFDAVLLQDVTDPSPMRDLQTKVRDYWLSCSSSEKSSRTHAGNPFGPVARA
jgi:hypothetical protein